MKIKTAIREYLIEIEVRKYTPRTIKGYQTNLNLFLRFCEEKTMIEDVEDITLGVVKQLTQFLTGQGKKGTYVNTILKTVKSFIQYCYEEDYGGFNTKKNFKCCKEEKPVIITFQPAHVRKMLQDCNGYDFISVRDKAILTMLFEAGVRCLELCCIQPEDIHDDFIVIKGKNHKHCVLKPELFQSLKVTKDIYECWFQEYLASNGERLPDEKATAAQEEMYNNHMEFATFTAEILNDMKL